MKYAAEIQKPTINKWTSTTKYVDIETGEEINKENATNNYLIIKTKKYVTSIEKNQNISRGNVEYIRECKQSKQGKLFK